MRLGLLVILVGALFLLRDMGLISYSQWIILWPVIVILVGIAITLHCNCGRDTWCMAHKKGRSWRGVASNTCDCTCGACKDCIGNK